MARACRYSRTQAWSINWEPTNTATIASSAGKSISGFRRSKPYGRSARPTFRVTETTFELRHRTVSLRSEQRPPSRPLTRTLRPRCLTPCAAVDGSSLAATTARLHYIASCRAVHPAGVSTHLTLGTATSPQILIAIQKGSLLSCLAKAASELSASGPASHARGGLPLSSNSQLCRLNGPLQIL
jgi:hypothetical protein